MWVRPIPKLVIGSTSSHGARLALEPTSFIQACAGNINAELGESKGEYYSNSMDRFNDNFKETPLHSAKKKALFHQTMLGEYKRSL